MSVDLIRNFSIIAHIDHGKSTLADRMLLSTGTITEREFRDQLLDDMDIERERGITIKARSVAMAYTSQGATYQLNLIDTPGHVDFHYEVSRSLAACEGSLLLVDATQGVQAQTVANVYKAMELDHVIIPVLNKIDLPTSRPEEIMEEMEFALGVDIADVLMVSAKTGEGVSELMRAIIDRIPPPDGDLQAPLRAMVVDSYFDDYRGVVTQIRVKDGSLSAGDHMHFKAQGSNYEVLEVGMYQPTMKKAKSLSAGQVGYVISNIKTIHDVNVGDTVTHKELASKVEALPGFQEPKPMVFCGLFPTESDQFADLQEAIEKLSLNDASFTFQKESSNALGFGYRCGFLGLLHMEIIHERLEREYKLELIKTAPNVTYEVVDKKGEVVLIDNPANIPDAGVVEEFREPVIAAKIICPEDNIGAVMTLAQERRGTYLRTEHIGLGQVVLEYTLPLAEVVFDFYDRLKSATRGYGTLDYEPAGFQSAKLVRLDILVAGVPVDALSSVSHKDNAYHRGRRVIELLRKAIPRHLFEIPLQAAIGGNVIARETIKAMRKNVTAKCYGGDISRKRKLLEKQKAGKKRMKNVGSVQIPQEAFMSVLGIDHSKKGEGKS